MRKMSFWFLILLGLVGCEDKIYVQNGEIPEYLAPAVETFLGRYSGVFENAPAEFTLKLEGRRLLLEAAQDFLPKYCQSRVGSLEYLWVRQKNEAEIPEVGFFFDSGICYRVAGETVVLQFPKFKRSKKQTTFLQIFERYDNSAACSGSSLNCERYLWGEYLRVD